jgi:hypothetical protein
MSSRPHIALATLLHRETRRQPIPHADSHFPTAPLSSRDNNVMEYSERTGRNSLSQETASSCFDSLWSQQSNSN